MKRDQEQRRLGGPVQTPPPVLAAESSHGSVRVTTVTSGPPGLEAPFDDPWADWASPSPGSEGDGGDLSRILVPYNGTAVARQALEVATTIALSRTTVVWVLHVRAWDIGTGGIRFCLETKDEAHHCAQTAVTHLRRRGIAASALVRDARREKVPHAIAAEAARLEVGCIVLGTPARRALSSALVGSTSLTVARRATRPIILVKAPAHPRRRRWRSQRGPGDPEQS